jgi:(R,R)-butanediol dehydrogenase/meso-butanediol dehydrogenase/diacetyl reductase
MALMAARIRGAKRVVAFEIAKKRIEAALQCGADAVVNPLTQDPESAAREVTGGEGFDVVIECAGQPATVLMAGRLTRTRGRLVIMGVFDKPAALDLTDIVFREKAVTGSMSGYGLYDETIRTMTDPRFRADVLISDHIGLDDLISKGYHGLLHETENHVKILVRPE